MRTMPLLPLLAVALAAQPPGWKAYFGNLHSHSEVSDGRASPTAAFRHAREVAKVDFLCLSEHNHNIQTNTTQDGLDDVGSAATTATTAKFVALIGQEFSTISNGNHVNVYDVHTQIPFDLLNNYKALFEDFLPDYQRDNPGRVVVAQFNHPENAAVDYGRTRYRVKRGDTTRTILNYDENTQAFVRGADRWVRLIAILSGPADVTQKDATDLPFDEHRDIESKRLKIWHRYLDLGMHLSPAADQDNHSKSWGNRTAARTAVWIEGALTRESLLQAFRSNRTYATEDRNLSIWFTVNGRPMGSRMTPGEAGPKLKVQVIPRDADESGASYAMELFRETIGDGDPPELVEKSGLIKNGGAWNVEVDQEDDETSAYMVKVTQFSGDKRDDVWTAPIWIEPAAAAPPGAPEVIDHPETGAGTAKFVGSRNSEVYHFPDCAVVKKIPPANIVEFASKPADRRLHKNCPQ